MLKAFFIFGKPNQLFKFIPKNALSLINANYYSITTIFDIYIPTNTLKQFYTRIKLTVK